MFDIKVNDKGIDVYRCECGGFCVKGNIARHLRTVLHTTYIHNQEAKN